MSLSSVSDCESVADEWRAWIHWKAPARVLILGLASGRIREATTMNEGERGREGREREREREI